jgi:hypothetical protein
LTSPVDDDEDAAAADEGPPSAILIIKESKITTLTYLKNLFLAQL